MHLTIAKVHEQLFSGDAASVSVPTTEGVITILPTHEPLVATIAPGMVVARTPSGEQQFTVESGVLEVTGSSVTVLL